MRRVIGAQSLKSLAVVADWLGKVTPHFALLARFASVLALRLILAGRHGLLILQGNNLRSFLDFVKGRIHELVA